MTMTRWITRVALVSSIFGCGGDGILGGLDPSGVVTLTHNGTPWTATSRSSAYAGGHFSMHGFDGQGRSVTIAGRFHGLGTHPLGPGNSNGTAYWVDATGSYNPQGPNATGSITLTSVTTARVAGTFSFVGSYRASTGGQVMTITIDNGRFDVAR